MAERSTNPTPGEIVIMAAGAVAFIFSFFNFYKAGDQGVSAWGKGLFPVATLMVLLVVVMALHIALTRFANLQLPQRVLTFTWEQVHLVLGFFATLLAVCWLLRSKLGADFGVGFWFILIACIAALVGAVLLWRERVGTHPDSPAT